MAKDPKLHIQRKGRSRSAREKADGGGWSRLVERVGVGRLGPDSKTTGIGAANVANASGRTQAATGTTYEPTIAMTHAQRVARAAKCSPRSSACPTMTKARPIPRQYNIHTATTWHLP